MVGNKQVIYAYGSGSIKFESTIDQEVINITINDILFAPDAAENLISVGAIRKKICTTFIDDFCYFQLRTSDRSTVMVGRYQLSGLYLLNIKPTISKILLTRSKRTINEWHEALGHINPQQIEHVIKDNMVAEANIVQQQAPERCCVCPMGKATNSAHPTTTRELAKEVGDIIHMDLIGRLPTSLGGNEYALILTDEASNYRTIYAIKTKDQVVEKLETYFSTIECQSGRRAQSLWSDCGSEFINQRVHTLLAIEHVTLYTSSPRTPQQNGRAERSNRTIIEIARTQLASSGLPGNMWAEACMAAAYVLNRVGKSNNPTKTPYEVWYGRKPSISHIQPFGTCVHVLDKPRTGNKWAPKTIPAHLVGYTERINTYRCFIPKSQTVRITSDVIFRGHPRTLTQIKSDDNDASYSYVGQPNFNPKDETTQNDTIELNGPNVSLAPDQPKNVLSDYFRQLNEHGGQHSAFGNEIASNESIPCPEYSILSDGKDDNNEEEKTCELINDTNYVSWCPNTDNKQSTPSECSKNSTYTKSTVMGSVRRQISNLINLPKRSDGLSQNSAQTEQPQNISDPITNNKETEIRTTEGGVAYHINLCSIDPTTYKQALESGQKDKWLAAIQDEKQALEQNNTWSVVERDNNMHALSSKWVFSRKFLPSGEIDRFKARLVIRGFTQRPGLDYSETFAPVVHLESIRILFALITHYKLETIQFDIQTAFLNGQLDEEIYVQAPEGIDIPPNYVLKLNKSLYGLKQAPRVWKISFDKILSRLNFKPLLSDPCLFTGTINSEKIILAVYVDDGLAASSSKEALVTLIKLLSDELKTREVKTRKFVGLEFERAEDKSSLILHQQSYIIKMLERYNMVVCKGAKAPINDTNELQTRREEDVPTKQPYRELLGSLLYAACLTRIDICFAVSFLSRFCNEPLEKHWTAAKNVLRYLKETPNLGIKFTADSMMKLECFTDADWGGNLADRKSTSGVMCFLSGGPISFKTRKQAVVAQSTTEAEYIASNLGVREILGAKNVLEELSVKVDGVSLNMDNQSAIRLIKNAEYHQDTKHIDIKTHFIRDHFQRGLFQLQYVPSGDQKADILTKALPPITHGAMIKKIGMALAATVCLMAILLTPTNGQQQFSVEDPVLWAKEDVFFLSGQIDEVVKIELVDQCPVAFNNLTGLGTLDEMLAEVCSQRFNSDIIEVWKTVVSEHTKVARDGGLSLATVAALTGVFTSIAATIKVKDLQREQRIRNELVMKLDDSVSIIQNKLILANGRISLKVNKLEDRLERLGHIVAAQPRLQDALHQALAAIREYKIRLEQLKRQLKVNSEVPEIFLEIFNLTHLTNRATLSHSQVHRAAMQENNLKLQVTLPKVDYQVSIYKAKPFFYTGLENDKMCTFRYHGPEYMLHNKTSECMRPVSGEEIVNNAIVGEGCAHQRSLDVKQLFLPENCRKLTMTNLPKQPAQLKPYGVRIFINCQGLNITIGGKAQRCPNHVFSINEGTEFLVGNTHYYFERTDSTKTIPHYDVPARINLNLGTSKTIFSALDTEDIQELEKASTQLRKEQIKLRVMSNSTEQTPIFDLETIFTVGSGIHWFVSTVGSYMGMIVGVYIITVVIKERCLGVSTTVALIAILPFVIASDQYPHINISYPAMEATNIIKSLQIKMIERGCNFWDMNSDMSMWQRGVGFYPVSLSCALARDKITCPCSVMTETVPIVPSSEIKLLKDFPAANKCWLNRTQEFKVQLTRYKTLVEYLCFNARLEPADAWPRNPYSQLVATGCIVAKFAYNCHCPGNDHQLVFNDILTTAVYWLERRKELTKENLCQVTTQLEEKNPVKSIIDKMYE